MYLTFYPVTSFRSDVITIPHNGEISLHDADTPLIVPLTHDTSNGAYPLWIRLTLVGGSSGDNYLSILPHKDSQRDARPIATLTPSSNTAAFTAQSLQRFSIEKLQDETAVIHAHIYRAISVSSTLATSGWKDSSHFKAELVDLSDDDGNSILVYNGVERQQQDTDIQLDMTQVESHEHMLYAVRYNDAESSALVQHISVWDKYTPVKITPVLEMSPPVKQIVVAGVDIGSLSQFSVWVDVEVSDAETGTIIDAVTIPAPKLILDSPRTVRYVDCLQPVKVRTTVLSQSLSPVILASDTVLVDARVFCRVTNRSDNCFCESLCESAGDGNGDGLAGYDDPDCSRSDILQFLTVKDVSDLSYKPTDHEEEEVDDGKQPVLMNVVKHTTPSSSCSRLAATSHVDYSDYIDKGKAGRAVISIDSSTESDKWNNDLEGKRWRWSLSMQTETDSITTTTMDYYYTTGQSQLPDPIVFFVDFSTRYYPTIIVTSVVTDESGRELPTVTDDKCELHVSPFTTQPAVSMTLLLPLQVFSKTAATPVIIFSISTTTPIASFDSDARARFLAVTSTRNPNPGIYIVHFVAMLAANETEFALSARLSSVRQKTIIVTTTRSDNVFLRPLTTAIMNSPRTAQQQLYSCGASETITMLSVVNPTPLKYRVLLDGLMIYEGGPHEQKIVDVKVPTRALTTNGIYVAELEVLYSMEDIDDSIQRKLDVLANSHHIEVLPHIPTSVRLEAVEYQADERACEGMVKTLFLFPEGGIDSPVHYFSSNDEDIGNTRLYDRVDHYLHRDRNSPITVHAYLASDVAAGYNLQCSFSIDTRTLKSAWTVVAPKINADLTKSATSYTGNSIILSVGAEVVDMLSLSGPDGLVAIRRQPQPYSSHTFSKLAYGSYIVTWQSEYRYPSLVCKWNKIVQISFPAEASIVTQVSSGEERIMCPYSFFNSANIWQKYWTLTLAEEVVKNADQYSVSVDLWDIDHQTKIMLEPEEGSNKRLYSHMLAHPGSYSADVQLALYDANGNAKTSAVFSTPVYTVQQPLFTEESFELHFTNPRCIYSNDGVVDLSYPPELVGNVKTRIKSCVPLLNGTSTCANARITDNLRITGMPFCKELVLEYTIFHGCRFTKTFALLPVSSAYPMLSGIKAEATCDGDYILTAMVHNFFEQTTIPLRVDYRYAAVEWRYGQDSIGSNAQIRLSSKQIGTSLHSIAVSVSTAGGCRTDAVLQHRELPEMKVVDVAWGETLPIYCPGEHDASLSVKIPADADQDTVVAWTVCAAAASTEANGTSSNQYDNCATLPNSRNKRRVDNLSPGLYRVTATRHSSVCSKTLETIIAEKADYHVKNFIEVDYAMNRGEVNTVRIAATGDAPIEVSAFTASMLTVEDRRFLSQSSSGTPVLVGVPSLHAIKIDIPQPDVYRRYTRLSRCSKPLTINVWRASTMARVIDPTELPSPYVDPAVVVVVTHANNDTMTMMPCAYSAPPPLNVTVYNKRSNTTLMAATIVAHRQRSITLMPTVTYNFTVPTKLSFRDFVGEDSYKSLAENGIINKTFSLAEMAKNEKSFSLAEMAKNEKSFSLTTKLQVLNVVKVTAGGKQTLCDYTAKSNTFDCGVLKGYRELAVTYYYSHPSSSQRSDEQRCREFILLDQASPKLTPRAIKEESEEEEIQYAIVPADMPISTAAEKVTTRVHKTHEKFVWYRLLTTIKDSALPRPRIHNSAGAEIDEQCMWQPINVFPWVSECLIKLPTGENYRIDTSEESRQRSSSSTSKVYEIRAASVQGEMSVMVQVTVTPTTQSACNGVVSVVVYGGFAPYYMTTSRNNGQNNDARDSVSGKFYIDNVCVETFTVSVRDSIYGVDEWSTSIVRVTTHESFAIDSLSVGLAEGCGLWTTTNVTVGFLDTQPATIGAWDAYHYPLTPLTACTDSRMLPASRVRISSTTGGAGGNFYSLQLTLGNWTIYACDRTGNMISTEPSFGVLDFTTQNVPISVQIFHGNVCIPELGGQINIEQWNLPHLLVYDSTPPLALYDDNNEQYLDVAVENVTDALAMQIRGLPLGSSSWWLWDSRKCPTEIVIVNKQLPAGICGTCNESDTSCYGCDGVAWSRTTTDICGACGGTEACLHDCEFDGSVRIITQKQLATEATECTELLGYNNMVFTVPVTTFRSASEIVLRTTIQRLTFAAGLTVPQGTELLIEDSIVNNLNITNSTHIVITGGQLRHVLTVHSPARCTNHTMNIRIRDVDVDGLTIKIVSSATCRPLVRIRLRFVDVSLLVVVSDTDVDFIVGESNITRIEFSGNGNVDLNTTSQSPSNSDGEYPYHIDTIDINKETTMQQYKLMGCRILLKTPLVGKVTFGDRFTVQYRERQCAVDMNVVLALRQEAGFEVDYRDPFDYYDVGGNLPLATETPNQPHEQNLFTIVMFIAFMTVLLLVMFLYLLMQLGRR